MHVAPARRRRPAQGANEVGAAGYRGRRQVTVDDKARLAIKIAQHRFHQVGALGDTLRDMRPLRLAQDQRQRAERPDALVILAIDAVRDTGVADAAGGEIDPVREVLRAESAERGEELQPMIGRATVRADQLVGNPFQGPIGAQPALQPALRPARAHRRYRG